MKILTRMTMIAMAAMIAVGCNNKVGTTTPPELDDVSGPADETELSIYPAVPQNAAAVAGDAEATLTWDAVDGAVSYNVYWDDEAGVDKGDTKIPGVASPYEHTGITNGTTYYYVVAAVDGNDIEGELSAEVSAAPAATAFKGEFLKKLTAGAGEEASAYFGQSVSISGERLIIGQPYKKSPTAEAGAGAVYLYKYSSADGNWQEDSSKISTLGSINYGYSVSMSGDDAIVGIPHAPALLLTPVDLGAVMFYKNDGTAWNLASPESEWASNPVVADQFGASVAIDGDYAIVGAPKKVVNGMPAAGGTYIFKNDGTAWAQSVNPIGYPIPHINLGYSVGIHGDSAIVGAPYIEDSGRGWARIYIRAADETWNSDGWILPTGLPGDARFGYSVAIGDNFAVIGAPYDDFDGKNQAGAVYVYKREGDAWVFDVALHSNAPQVYAKFGKAVAINGDYLVVGVPDEGYSGLDGVVYVFQHKETGWGEPMRIMASDGEEESGFGTSVAMDGATLVIGAPYKDESVGNNAGAVYIFK